MPALLGCHAALSALSSADASPHVSSLLNLGIENLWNLNLQLVPFQQLQVTATSSSKHDGVLNLMIFYSDGCSLPHELQCRPFWFPDFFPANRHGCRRFTCFVRHTENPKRVHRSLNETSNEAKGNMFTTRKNQNDKNISFEVSLMFIVNVVHYVWCFAHYICLSRHIKTIWCSTSKPSSMAFLMHVVASPKGIDLKSHVEGQPLWSTFTPISPGCNHRFQARSIRKAPASWSRPGYKLRADVKRKHH